MFKTSLWGASCDHHKTSISIYQKKAFSVQCVRKLRPYFSYTNFNWTKMRRRSVVLHLLERYKYFREGHSVGQTVVKLSSIYCKPLRRASCFFQKGWSSGIATLVYFFRDEYDFRELICAVREKFAKPYLTLYWGCIAVEDLLAAPNRKSQPVQVIWTTKAIYHGQLRTLTHCSCKHLDLSWCLRFLTV